MVDQSSQLKSRIETGTKKVEELEKALAKTSPLTAERKIAQRDLTQERERLALLQQEQTYVEIRTERRRVEARRAYKIAFMKDQPWPDPKEFEYFLTNYRLKTASRHWEARIPKLQDRLPSSKPGKDKKQAAKEAEE